MVQPRPAERVGCWLARLARAADVRSFAIQKGVAVLRELPTVIRNMTDGDAAACQLDHGLGRISALFTIDVARDGGDQSHLLQMFDHGPIANVPGVENVIDASEMSPDGRLGQALGNVNGADPNGVP